MKKNPGNVFKYYHQTRYCLCVPLDLTCICGSHPSHVCIIYNGSKKIIILLSFFHWNLISVFIIQAIALRSHGPNSQIHIPNIIQDNLIAQFHQNKTDCFHSPNHTFLKFKYILNLLKMNYTYMHITIGLIECTQQLKLLSC